MLATSTAPFDDSSCLFEIKWDGVRALTAVEYGKVTAWGREGVDYTSRYPELEALRQLPPGTILDGELVMLRDGLPDFHALMGLRHSRRPRKLPFFAEAVRYVVFDLLYLAGASHLHKPLIERREVLHDRLPESPFITTCEGVIGKGKAFFKKAVAAGHEGVVAKRITSRYSPNNRSKAWQKIKQKMQMPCAVIGYRVGPEGLRDLFMASTVDGDLAYVGSVELGIDQPHEALTRLESLRIPVRLSLVPCRPGG